jgi:hypothetical protein
MSQYQETDATENGEQESDSNASAHVVQEALGTLIKQIDTEYQQLEEKEAQLHLLLQKLKNDASCYEKGIQECSGEAPPKHQHQTDAVRRLEEALMVESDSSDDDDDQEYLREAPPTQQQQTDAVRD